MRDMLHNIIYIGHMPQLRWTSLSYKNKKRFRKDESEWTIIYNTHEPIISQELWDKVHARMKSVSNGKTTKQGYTHPLSGFLFCADCGQKLKLAAHRTKKGSLSYYFNCGYYSRYGKHMCFSHYISAKVLEEIILGDIREMAQRIVLDEKAIREEFIRHNAELADKAVKRKYSDEKKMLAEEIIELETRLTETESKQQSVDDFIRDIKKYLNAPELTREMCYELIDRIVIGGLPESEEETRMIDVVYKVDIMSVLRYKFQ